LRRPDYTGTKLAQAAAGHPPLDPLTHALSGAALARAVSRQALPKRSFILLILLTMAPDIDILLRLVSDTFYLQHHRGITHSLLMMPLWCWLIAALLRRQRNPIPATWIGAALLLHIILDTATSFGTMILAPFSDWRATLDLVFIIDPLLSACLLLPLLCGMLWRNHARSFAIVSLMMTGTYLGMTGYLHHKALRVLQQQQPQALAIAALPLPFSPFHWQLIARYANHYQRSFINLWPAFAGSKVFFSSSFVAKYAGNIPDAGIMQWQSLPAMNAIDLPANTPGIHFYHWFARFPVLLNDNGQQLEFGDLRFAAGLPGVSSPFRLRIKTGTPPEAWLIWRDGQESTLH